MSVIGSMRALVVALLLTVCAVANASTTDVDELELICAAGQTSLGPGGTRVQARADGVHIWAVNLTGRPMLLAAGGDVVPIPPSGLELVLPLDPGLQIISCDDPNAPIVSPPAAAERAVAVEVVPHARWRAADLKCAGALRVVAHAIPAPPLSSAAALMWTTAAMRGVRSRDTIERLGYSAGTLMRLRMIRAGRVIGGVDFAQTPDGWVTVGGAQQCVDDLPARLLRAQAISSPVLTSVLIDADTVVLTRRTTRVLTGALSLRCGSRQSVRVGEGAFLRNERTGVIRLRRVASASPGAGRCVLRHGGREIARIGRLAMQPVR